MTTHIDNKCQRECPNPNGISKYENTYPLSTEEDQRKAYEEKIHISNQQKDSLNQMSKRGYENWTG